MRGLLIDMADVIIYATGLFWLTAGVYLGVQVLSEFGHLTRGLIAGVLLIVGGGLAASLHCLICFAILDIRAFTRHAAKQLGSGR
ncbi:hypothetical protein [Rhodobacter maris]|uniref:DUF4282 domain-containing protein n=1 Tax=Rhodobacter maris TaxID=446682 RepID=A0A285THH7_9RHOB|nr:hypothetical protein [Rhodobacter maris]SOC21407.1 hypothetical protein SAMN05877831_12312 [Rhodobacter maris]